MGDNSQIFFNKKILIYGLGKSGLSSFNFLRNKSDVYLFDDDHRINAVSALRTVIESLDLNDSTLEN